jgi:antitoxin ParD1/3/4
MATRNINLTDALDRFVAELIASGQYQNASEVVRHALRLLKTEEEQRARKLELLRQAVQEGWDSFDRGEGVVVEDIDAFFAEIDAEIEAEIEAEEAAARGTAAE